MDNLELLEIVNFGLAEGKSVTQIGREINLSESAIRKRLNRIGYKRQGNKFVADSDITSNITPNKVIKKNRGEIKATTDDMDKLQLLLDNLDKILKLIPNDNFDVNFRSNSKQVTTLRIDSGVYGSIKDYAQKRNLNISDIVEKALIDYLNNYL